MYATTIPKTPPTKRPQRWAQTSTRPPPVPSIPSRARVAATDSQARRLLDALRRCLAMLKPPITPTAPKTAVDAPIARCGAPCKKALARFPPAPASSTRAQPRPKPNRLDTMPKNMAAATALLNACPISACRVSAVPRDGREPDRSDVKHDQNKYSRNHSSRQ